ncbi:MAG: hypothetical protein E7049_10580 [Lentisphaerae bacterium]|nr:hypothetical protein [Lentisphaerota bacterium]
MKTPTNRTARRLAAVLSLAFAFAATGAWAEEVEKLYWTGATSTDYNTADNWSAKVSPVGTTQWYHTYDTAHIQSYRIDIAGFYGTRGGWWINAGTENEPVQFYCEEASQGISPNNSVNSWDFASYLHVADKSDAWAWFNGGKYDKFKSVCNVGSSSYAGHITIGNDRGVATIMNFGGDFNVNNGTVNILGDATLSIDDNIVVGQIASRKGTLTIDGGSCSANKLLIGDLAGATGDVVVNSGNMSIRNNLLLGQKGTGTLTINGGTFEVESGMLAYVGKANGTITLNSGKLIATDIQKEGDSGMASLVFNGGTLAANGVSSDALIRSTLPVTVGANGGTIDAAGYNVTIAADLGNAAGATGAMTFKGGGMVTLSGAINYTGGTTVEVGTTLVVPSAIDNLAFTIPEGIVDGMYEVVHISGGGVFASDVLEHASLPSDVNANFFLNSRKTGIYCRYGAVSGDGKVWVGVAGDRKLSSAENWLDNTEPSNGDILNFSMAGTPVLLDADLGEVVPATMLFGTKLITITNGTLTVNTLTNASKLAVASGATLTVVGNIVATPTVIGGTSYFLYSNEGTVTVGGEARGIGFDGWPRVYQYQVANANTQPIRARKLVYDCPGGKRIYMHLSSAGDKPGKWVVGEDGMTFAGTRQIEYTKFLVENSGADVTLYSSADWTLKNTGVNGTDNGDLHVKNNATLTIDTSDYDDSTIRRTVTLEGRLNVESTVTITGCGTVEIATTKHNGLAETTVASGNTLAVTDTATLKVNAGKKILGAGTISLAAGTTLALESTDREFATPDIVPVTLPEEGAAKICIDGMRLRRGEHVLCTLASVPENLADHVTVTGTALDGRKYEVKAVEVTENETTVTKLVLDILPTGLMLIFR